MSILNKRRIFLSGGTHGSWQDKVMRRLKDAEFFDPRTLRNQPMDLIAKTERAWLDLTDCLFFYFAADNPSGLGSAFEVGYCVANNIPVIFVDEKHTTHSQWLGVHCSQVFFSFEEGLDALETFINQRSNLSV
jgi:nucleoside 2-deoxyribosyltransferase